LIAPGPEHGLPAELFVADLFHPVNDLAVEIFLNGDVRLRDSSLDEQKGFC